MFFEFTQNLSNFFLENLSYLTVSLFLALLAAFLWLIFYYYLSEKLTTSQISLLKIFIFGMIAALFAVFFEKGILPYFTPEKIDYILNQEIFVFNLEETFLIFIITFILVALPEEIIKFFFLKTLIFKSKSFDQIIDGIKFGIVFGLGFGTIENIFFFFSQFSSVLFDVYTVLNLFLMRFLVPTLAHSIYGGIMGYFLSLAKFYRIFQTTFFWKALIIPFLIHGIFNYLLFTPFNLIVAFLLIFTLLTLLKWYLDRQNFQIMISKMKPNSFIPPILSEPEEMQALLFKNLPKFHLLKKFGICPFCFKKLKIIEKKCSYCNHSISF